MDTNLTGEVAQVTGASQGIGEAIARGLHREGAKIALVARTQAKLDALARELGDRAFSMRRACLRRWRRQKPSSAPSTSP